jgi:hypothetical protein
MRLGQAEKRNWKPEGAVGFEKSTQPHDEELSAYVGANPDAYLRGIAVHFNVVWWRA